MRLDMLVEVTNKLLRTDPTSGVDLREMLAVGCKELRILISDPTFFTEMRSASGQTSLIEEATAIFNDPGRFAAFLDEEKRVFLEAGLHPDVVREVIKQADDLRPSLAKRPTLEDEALRISLVKLANEICNLADLSEPCESEQFRKTVRPVLRRASLTISGATVVSANIAAAANLGHAYAAASIAIGAGMIKEGIFGA